MWWAYWQAEDRCHVCHFGARVWCVSPWISLTAHTLRQRPARRMWLFPTKPSHAAWKNMVYNLAQRRRLFWTKIMRESVPLGHKRTIGLPKSGKGSVFRWVAVLAIQHRRVRVIHPKGTRFDPEYKMLTVRQCVSVMVWECFWRGGIDPLLSWPGSWINPLSSYFINWKESIQNVHGTDPLLLLLLLLKDNVRPQRWTRSRMEAIVWD